MPDKVKEQEPLWREEFSISKADERYVNRRQLAKFLTLGSLGNVRGQLLDSRKKLVAEGAGLSRGV